MGLDRGVLAEVDRRLLAGLGQGETWRMVRVLTAPTMWSTWNRCCELAGVSMGRAIATLIDHELSNVLGDTEAEGSPVQATRIDEGLAKREAEVALRQQELQLAEARLRVWDKRLCRWERDLEARERRAFLTAGSPILPGQPRGRVGRNEPCPCGSGRKYKRCHGAPPSHSRRSPGTGGLTGRGGLGGRRRRGPAPGRPLPSCPRGCGGGVGCAVRSIRAGGR